MKKGKNIDITDGDALEKEVESSKNAPENDAKSANETEGNAEEEEIQSLRKCR